MTTPIKYNAVFVMGPSAAGKTFSVKNKLLPTLGIDKVYAIDGGDMREASIIYQTAIKQYGIKAFSKKFKKNGKETITPLLIDIIKSCIKSECDEVPNEGIEQKYDVKKMTYEQEIQEPKFKRTLACAATKSRNDSIACEDENWKQYAKHNPKTGKNPHIAYVKTFITHFNSSEPTYEEKQSKLHNKITYRPKVALAHKAEKWFKGQSKTLSEFHTKVLKEQNEDEFMLDKSIFMLVLAPKKICKIQGETRQTNEGKAYDNAMWYLCVKSGFIIMMRKMSDKTEDVKDRYDYHISLNMGANNNGIFDKNPKYLKKPLNIDIVKQIKETIKQLETLITDFNGGKKTIEQLKEIEHKFWILNTLITDNTQLIDDIAGTKSKEEEQQLFEADVKALIEEDDCIDGEYGFGCDIDLKEMQQMERRTLEKAEKELKQLSRENKKKQELSYEKEFPGFGPNSGGRRTKRNVRKTHKKKTNKKRKNTKSKRLRH